MVISRREHLLPYFRKLMVRSSEIFRNFFSECSRFYAKPMSRPWQNFRLLLKHTHVTNINILKFCLLHMRVAIFFCVFSSLLLNYTREKHIFDPAIQYYSYSSLNYISLSKVCLELYVELILCGIIFNHIFTPHQWQFEFSEANKLMI